MHATISPIARWGALLLGLGALAAPAQAVPVILNGGFEAGLSSWTRLDQIGSDGSFMLQSGTLSPLNGDPVPPPTEGLNAAMTDAFGPGSHLLYQDFLASAGAATLSFDLSLGNRADRYATPASLDFALTSQIGSQTHNQQARVDILQAGANPFSVDAADILLTLYHTQVGDALVAGYNTVTADLSALLAANDGQLLRLRFAETDNLGPFQMGIDDVRIVATATVPEPASGALLAAALAAIAATRTGRRRSVGLAAA